MKTQVHLTATIPAADGMIADKAKTAALVTASQTFRVPLEVVSVKEVAGGFEVTLRRVERTSLFKRLWALLTTRKPRTCDCCGLQPACHRYRRDWQICNDCDHNARG